jgi:thiol-disulfide isomerase/thioredoxin
MFIAVMLAAIVIGAASVLLIATRRKQPPAPVMTGLTIETADGRRLSEEAFRGRFVLLNVWATWCPPCVKEMPSLDRLQAMKDRQGLEVVQPFFQRTGLTYLAIYLDREARSMPALKITGLPTTVLIDPAGREIARWPGAREWDQPATVAEIDEHIARSRETDR